METKVKECDTYWVKIYMAGDIDVAKQTCREFCMIGLCVNIHETDYIYTLGEENGFCVELINYPRFPTTSNDITNKATELADLLMERCFQGSYSLMTPEKTYWVTRREGDKD
jgi:hypothetical protein